MNRNLFVGVFLVLLYGANSSWAQPNEAKLYYIKPLLQRIHRPSDTTYILNFWATWCAPCVKELPEFVKLHNQNISPTLKIILISLDFAKDLDKLNNFIKKKNIPIETVLLDEPKYNTWIDSISTGWEGAIPATLIYNKRKNFKQLINKTVNYEELYTISQALLR